MGSQTVKHHRRATSLCAAAALVAALATTGCSLLTPSRADVVPEQTLTKLSEPTIATKGVLTVGLDTSDAPLAMQQDDTVSGYLADVARALAHRLGLKVAFVDAASASAAGDTCDVYLVVTKDDAPNAVTLAGTVLEEAPALFGNTTRDASAPTAGDLAGATVAVQAASASQDTLSACGIEAQQKTYSNINACFEALVAGEVDYVACDTTAGAYLSRQCDGVGFVGSIDAASAYDVAVRSGASDLSSAIADAVNALTSDGVLDAVHQAWFGSLPSVLADTLIQGVATTADREAAAAQEQAQADEQASDDNNQDSSNPATQDNSSAKNTDDQITIY